MNLKKKVLSCLLAAGFFMLSVPILPITQETFALDSMETLEELRKSPVEEIAKRKSYDSRQYGIVTSVKNQSPLLLCWAYASLAAAETSILREGFDPALNSENLDLDEIEAAKAACGKFLDPLSLADGSDESPKEATYNKGGYVDFITRIASHWQGVMLSSSVQKKPQEQYSEFILENAVKCTNDVDEIKALVARYGGVAFEYNEGYTDYHIAKGPVSHVSEIVGWNDEIKKENFSQMNGTNLAKRDGAWLVKNSWGVERNNYGYFWLSYDSDIQNITAFDFGPRRDDALLYNYAGNQTDKMYWSATNTVKEGSIAYTFEPKGKCEETLDSVMVGISGENVKVKVDVYDTLSSNEPVTSEEFETNSYLHSVCTLPLKNPVKLQKDKEFCVVVTVYNGGFLLDFAGDTGNAKCYTESGNSWSKLKFSDGQLPVIHPITKINPNDREKDYGAELYGKMRAFDDAVKLLPASGMIEANYAGFVKIKESLEEIDESDRSKLWLTDEIRISRYEAYIKLWSDLTKNVESAIELSKKFL